MCPLSGWCSGGSLRWPSGLCGGTMKSCAGCGVGPDDECEPGCVATVLVRVGWSAEQAEDILLGKMPRHISAEVMRAKVAELAESLRLPED